MLDRLHSLVADKRFLIGCWFLLMCIGIGATMDYGMPYDEGTMQSLGRDTYNYVFHGHTYPETTEYRYHGAWFEILLHGLQRMFVNVTVETQWQIFAIRRSVTFFVFSLGVIGLYLLAWRTYKSRWLALLAATILVLSPHIFVHSLANSRDIPTMVFFTLSMYTLTRLHSKRTYASAVVHGITMAFAFALRMPSLMLLPITFAHLLIDVVCNKGKGCKQVVLLLTATSAAAAVGTIALWPLLWENPIRIYEALLFFRNLNMQTYFLGNLYVGSNPWYYVPVWVFVTTPIAYTLLFLTGTGTSLASLVKDWRKFIAEQVDTRLYLMWFFGPILVLILVRGSMWGGWRHFYFIYPAFILLAMRGLQDLLTLCSRCNKQMLKNIVVGMTAVSVVWVGIWMLRHRGLQFTYFSIPGSYIEGNFDPDDRGFSNLQALKLLLKQPHPVLLYNADENLTYYDHAIFLWQTRLQPEKELEEAMYLLHRPRYNEPVPVDWPKIDEIVIDGITIHAIYANPRFFIQNQES